MRMPRYYYYVPVRGHVIRQGDFVVADVEEPVNCAACGRQLPEQKGRGRRREYCDATCRSSARRHRRASGRAPSDDVKNNLTEVDCHDYLDSVGGVPPAVRDAAGRLAAQLARPGGGSSLAAVAAARDLTAAADAALQEAVDRARDASRSWREIGEVLGTSRQAAFQRFGHPMDPRTGALMARDIPPGAADRGAALFACFAGARWDQVLGQLDDRMRERHDADRLAGGWAGMVGLIGRFERAGEPVARRAGDDTVVEVPLHFEAGEATGRVRFDRDGKIAGLRLQLVRDSDTEWRAGR